MQPSQTLKNSYDLLYLISCALHDISPKRERMEDMDLVAVYKLAKFHSLQAISFAPLERYEGKLYLPDEIYCKWSGQRQAIIQKNALMDLERAKLFDFFEEQRIRYLPMKGLVLRKLYPQMGWRYLADNDILFDCAYRKQVRDYFRSQGYKVTLYERSVHDIYAKPPFYNFEMHVSFFGNHYDDIGVQAVADYYRDPWRFCKQKEGKCEHYLTNEDFYLHALIAHAYKHVRHGGTGLRTLVDVYVYLREISLNRDYVEEQLRLMGLTEFEAALRELSFKLFESSKALTKDQEELLLVHADSGTYGTFSSNISTRISNFSGGKMTFWTKVRYCLRRIFPDMNYYREHAPFFYRHKVLIPAFLFWRSFKAVFIKRNIGKELKVVKNAKSDGSKK